MNSPPRSRPLLIYDGDCGFCRRWIARWRAITQDLVEYAPSQEVAGLFPDIAREKFDASVVLVEPDGSAWYGAEAAFRALASARGRGGALWVYRHVPGAAKLSERAYRFVAEHRLGFSRITRWLWGEHVEPPNYHLARWLFLRVLGIIYLVAFLSLGAQAAGLIGSDGILPAARFLEAVRQSLGPERYRLLPTLCWFSASDGFLRFLWGGGAFLSVLLILGVAPASVLFGLWAFYLSLTNVGHDFLNFQWDALLLETGFLAIFFAPGGLRPGLARASPPSPVALALLRWLLFRLMFASGAVKLASDDPTWWNLTALKFHYETQPLPTWIGWYAHQLPLGFQRFSTGAMFAIELGAPFLIGMPRRPRMAAFLAMVGLQLLIALTGNYCFFNLLAFALCLLLLDDRLLSPLFPKRILDRLSGGAVGARKSRPLRKILVGAVATLILLVSGFQVAGLFRRGRNYPRMARAVISTVAPFRSINGYGLFARMTTARAEIIVEGSDDARTWRAYEFKWKPGNLAKRPGFVEPHQPRLDWQMWFAALGDFRRSPWFMGFMQRLLEGSPEVLALLEKNPFPHAPPKYLRAMIYRYHFTDLATRRATGHWWRRDEGRPYCPIVSLRRG